MGTYELLFCSKRNAASGMVTCEVVGTLNHYKIVKKRGNRGVKTISSTISISSTRAT